MSKQRFAVVGTVAVVACVLLVQSPVLAQGVMFVNNDKVGIGVDSPDELLHVKGAGVAQIFVEDTEAGPSSMFRLKNAGRISFVMENTVAGLWKFSVAKQFSINTTLTPGPEFKLNERGDLRIAGELTTAGCDGCGADFVFEDDYELMPLSALADFVAREKHLPNIPTSAEMDEGINMSELQIRLLEKIEELTLYAVAQHDDIASLRTQNEQLLERLEALEQK